MVIGDLALRELAEIGQFVAGIASVVVAASVLLVWKQVNNKPATAALS